MGVGRKVAVEIFNRFPGQWEVIQHGDNQPSMRFWQTVIQEYTHGKYRKEKAKTEYWEGQALIFDNSTNAVKPPS